MLLDGIFEGYKIQRQLVHGSFGQVYVVKSDKDGQIYAGKTEVKSMKHSSILFENKIYSMLQSSKYVPRFVDGGTTLYSNYLIIEFIGPSITAMLNDLKRKCFSLSTGIRLSYHIFLAIKEIHELGVIHRDIKPSNILIHKDHDIPIKIIDFGLSRIYIDQKTGSVLPARDSPGFRGTATYCSVSAHNQKELGRCDDLISWFYVCFEFILGGLPWKNFENRDDIYKYKRTHDIGQFFRGNLPEFSEIWNLIKRMNYDDEPDYNSIISLLTMAMNHHNINFSDHYDWETSESDSDNSSEDSEDFD